MDSTEPKLDTRRPFTRAAALKAGIAPGLLRGAKYRTIVRGVHIDADVPDTPVLRIEAILGCFDKSAFASHTSAARVYGVQLPITPTEHVSVTDPAHRRRRAGVECHLHPEARVVIREGLRVSTPTQMFVELGSILNLVDLVVVGDYLVRKGLVRCKDLQSYCRSSSLAGAGSARIAASYVRERVDSPMESRLRMLLVLAGFPEPEVNLTIRDVEGEPIRRYDLCWPSAKVIVEYDGRHHIERIDQWESDLARREAIDDDEWRILVVVASGIYKYPGATVDRVWRLLRRRKLIGVPNRPSDAWRPHFPGRT